MPKSEVTDLITDQEIAFARLILSGTMTDRDAAKTAGLNPETAAYTKAKPRVRAYMLEHRAAVQQRLAEQEAEGQRQLNLLREQVLNRLWEIAALGPEMTRGSISGQVKALSMIVAMEGLIPDPRAASAIKKSVPRSNPSQIDSPAWTRSQHEEAIDSQPGPALAPEEDGTELAHYPAANEPEMPQNGQKISNFIKTTDFSTAAEPAMSAPA